MFKCVYIYTHTFKRVPGPTSIEEAPWLLLFARGELILSENPHAFGHGGGLGFAARLRPRCVPQKWRVSDGKFI